jgi:AP-3 complex subunit beta
LDADQLDLMIEVVDILLKDSATMVLGAAVAAFNEICPDRFDLIHPNYRKLIHFLCDLDEWGQIAALQMFARYGRTQFLNPQKEKELKKKERAERRAAQKARRAARRQKRVEAGGADSPHTSDESSDDEYFSSSGSEDDKKKDDDDFMSGKFKFESMQDLEPDLRAILEGARPLLQSRNAGVVMGVASLYHYLAPKLEQQRIAKALIRILKGRREVQFVVLNGIASMAATNPDMFRPCLSDFFILSTDPSFIRTLKLDIITRLANESNISKILREVRTYVTQEDKDFVKASIQAIGRCATSIPEVAETCMQSLTGLISNHSEAVVAEAVVVIKQLLQMPAIAAAKRKTRHRTSKGGRGRRDSDSDDDEANGGAANDDDDEDEEGGNPYEDVIAHLARLLETVSAPAARAAIVWVIGEHVENAKIRKVAPDVLRQLAKSFAQEDELVKLQVLNLGAKLLLTNPEQTSKIFTYVMNLAKYDTNYDIRDRARTMRRILFNPQGKANILQQHAQSIFITKKPVPVVTNSLGEDAQGKAFAIGTVSSLVRHTVPGYTSMPDWATERSDASLRNPPKREWENMSYGDLASRGFGGGGMTGMGSDSMGQVVSMGPGGFGSSPAPGQNRMGGMGSNTSSPSMGGMGGMGPGAGAGAGGFRSPTQFNPAMMGYADRAEYERKFWGEGDSDDEDDKRPSGSRGGNDSGSESGSYSGSESGSYSSRSGSYSGSGSSYSSDSEDDRNQGSAIEY